MMHGPTNIKWSGLHIICYNVVRFRDLITFGANIAVFCGSNSKFLSNIIKFLPEYMASYPTKQ
jgi:hypothetical protein